MKRRFWATFLALCMTLGILPGRAWAAERPENSAYWENVSLAKAEEIAVSMYNRSSTEDMVLIYASKSENVTRLANIAKAGFVKAFCYYGDEGVMHEIFSLIDSSVTSMRMPIIAAYNGTTQNYKMTFGGNPADFLTQLEEVGLLGGSGGTDLLPFYSDNASDQNYPAYNMGWATTVKSYLYENAIGGVTRVEYYRDTVIVEDYDSTYRIQSRKEIVTELPIWGGFYAGEYYNFLIFGQENPDEDNSVEVIRVVKYSEDWERLGEANLRSINTIIPFEAGSLRCTEDNGMLYVRTCHQMYKSSDGLNHQANMTLVLQQSDMSLKACHCFVQYSPFGYVSHSFNQFILADQSGKIVCADHGDAYPRAIVLTRTGSSSTIQQIPGKTGYNFTGACLGGLAETQNGYVTAYNYDGVGTGFSSNEERHVYLGYTTKDGLTSTTKVVSNTLGTSTPMLVSTGLDGGYLLWNDANRTSDLYYTTYSDGGDTGEIRTATATLSDCQPILHDGKVVWYTTNYSAPVFYTLDSSGVTAISSIRKPCENHEWDSGVVTTEPTYETEGIKTFTCTVCGETKTEVIEKLSYSPGDLNGDDKVTMADVMRLARGAAGYVTLTEREQKSGDVTGDGKITMADVIRVARYAAGYSPSL